MLIIQRPTVEAIGDEEANRQRFAIGPPRARLRPHARQLAAAHAAVVHPGRGRHPGALRRRPPRVHDPRRASRRTSPTSSSTSRTWSCTGVSDEPVTLRLDVRGPATVTAGDIQVTARRRGPQPRPAHRHAQRQGPPGRRHHRRAGPRLRVGRPQQASSTIGVIPVDSIFSPVRRVAFTVEPTRVEQSTNFDRLVLDIETDGSISPREALASAGDTLRSLVSLVAEMSDAPPGPRARRRRRQRPARPTSTCPSRTSTCPSVPATASSGRRSTPSASWSRRPTTTCWPSPTSGRSRSTRSSRSSTSGA